MRRICGSLRADGRKKARTMSEGDIDQQRECREEGRPYPPAIGTPVAKTESGVGRHPADVVVVTEASYQNARHSCHCKVRSDRFRMVSRPW